MIAIDYSTSSFALDWSPSFIWHGYHITYFHIAIKNKTNSSEVDHDRVNTTFSDVIVSYTYRISHLQADMCTELIFIVTAFDNNERSLQPFNVTGRYPSSEIKEIANLI